MVTMVKLIIIILFIAVAAPSPSFAQGWRGIIPLHSTRADVEKLLGASTDECNCVYETENEVIRVDYATAPCEGYLRGWNVPADTVLMFTVRTNREQMFSHLRLDESKFSKAYDDTFSTYYASRPEGVQYAVSREGVVSSVSYIPSAKDMSLRCRCFPAEDGSIFRTPPLVSFSGVSLDDALSYTDNLAIELSNGPKNWKGYVIVYAGRRARAGEALAYGKRLRDHLVITRQVEAERVSVIDGGRREKLSAELYLFRDDIPPPPALPTIGSCEAEARGGTKRSKR